MKKQSVLGEWNVVTAGGCSNFGMFDRNPVFAFNVVGDETDT